jgi:Bacterial Ig domain
VSTNSGASWKTINGVPGPVNALIVDSHGDYFAATNNGVYKNGTALNTGLTSSSVTGLAASPTGNVYAATGGGLFVLPYGGSAWTLLSLNHTAITPYLVAVDPSNPENIYVALVGSGIAVSTNGGANWVPLTYSGLTHNQILSLTVQPATGNIFAGIISATDSFVAKISANGSTLIYSTCLGGSDNDLGQNLVVTPTGTAYVSGATISSNLPVTPLAYQPTLAGGYDAFAARIDAPAAIGPPYVDIDTPAPGAILQQQAAITVAGWAVDNYTTDGTAIANVLVLVDGNFAGNATYGIYRPDVCAILTGRPGCPNVGYTFTITPGALQPGDHTLMVCAIDSDVPAADVGCLDRPIIVTNAAPGPPTINIDYPQLGAILSGTVTVAGWAIDNATAVGTAISNVTVSVDGKAVGTAYYGVDRPAVCAAFPGRPGCPNVGFLYQLNASTLQPGAHTVTVSATDTDIPTPDTGSASVMVTVPGGTLPGPPDVFIDSFPQGANLTGTVTVSGWAVDNASGIGTPISSVQIEVDGTVVGSASYGTSRPDVCAILPGRPGCPNVGFTFELNTTLLKPGPHTVAAIATDSDIPTPDSATCTLNVTVTAAAGPSVVITNPPPGLIFLEAGSTTISGWALESVYSIGSAINPNSLQVTIDGNPAGYAVYGSNDQSVCTTYPGRPGCPNVGFTYQLNTAALPPGIHNIAVYASDTEPTPQTSSTAVNLSVVTSTTPPVAWLDSPTQGQSISGVFTMYGWAIDNRTVVGTAIGSVEIQVDGVPAGQATYGVYRPDVCAIIVDRPGCPNVGWGYSLNTALYPPGPHTITVVATDTDASPDSGSVSVNVTFTSSGGPG